MSVKSHQAEWKILTYSSLNNIVGKSVVGKAIELWRGDNLFDHLMTCVGIGYADTLLNDIGAELLLGQVRDVSKEGTAKMLRERLLILVNCEWR